MMENINRYDKRKLSENISNYMIFSDKLNEYICNGLIHFVVLPTLASNYV